MIENIHHITDLIYRSLADELTASEQLKLDGWLNASVKRKEWYQGLSDQGLQAAMRTVQERIRMMEEIHTRIRVATGISALRDGHINDSITSRSHREHFLKAAWFRYAAAIIIIFGIGAYLWNTQNDSRTITQTEPVPIKNDVLPGGQKAMLTLADGRTIVLDSAANGQLAIENGSEVIKKDGQVIYGAGQLHNIDVTFNTMSTPKGGQYQLTLADGTKVWLNAASSITYPTVFNGKTREVNITGEAYFEVKPKATKPFIVKTASDVITVLGTSFNINSYNDEDAVKISLVEGSVNVNNTNIKPGQAYKKGKVTATNVDQDIAWKNGYFDFEGAKLHVVMRQLSRWYDLKIVYEKDVPEITFFGELTRNVSLKGVLKMLEGAGVHFTLAGNTLYVKP